MPKFGKGFKKIKNNKKTVHLLLPRNVVASQAERRSKNKRTSTIRIAKNVVRGFLKK